MGKYSGNGMGPAFQAFWPSYPSRRITKAETAEQRRLEEASAAVSLKLHRLAKISPRLAKLANEARAEGRSWLEVAEALADVIREAERRERVLRAGEE